MIKAIYWAYMTQFRHTRDLPIWFRLNHAYEMGRSTYAMPRTHRNKMINRQLKSLKRKALSTDTDGEDKS